MAKSCFTTLIQASNTLHHSKTHIFTIYIPILFYNSLCNISLYSHAIPIELTDTDNYLPPDDPNITNHMVSHYDCEKQHYLRQFYLLNVKPCTEAPSNIHHAKVRPQVYVRAKAKRVKAFKREVHAKKERKICFQGSVKYRRGDRPVWNHNTLPLPITLDPIECKILIRHPNGTNNKILNNFHYNHTFTLLEDHYSMKNLNLEQYQTPFTVYNFKTMYTGLFTLMPGDKLWIYVPKNNPFQNCPAHNQVNLLSWRVSVSEVELTYDDTKNLMVMDGHATHFHVVLLTVFVNPLLKLLSQLFGLVTTFVKFSHSKTL